MRLQFFLRFNIVCMKDLFLSVSFSMFPFSFHACSVELKVTTKVNDGIMELLIKFWAYRKYDRCTKSVSSDEITTLLKIQSAPLKRYTKESDGNNIRY
jgi:hypothetical protein